MPSTMVHVRVDEKVKEEASATLATMGICFRRCAHHVNPYCRGEGASFRGAGSECHDGQGHAIRRYEARQAVPILEGIA
jgi:hypothetical protein